MQHIDVALKLSHGSRHVRKLLVTGISLKFSPGTRSFFAAINYLVIIWL